MAQISKGILGGFSGTVGSVVGTNWRGKNIIRSLPKASKKQPTQAQVQQRTKFGFTQQFVYPLKPLFNLYFGNPAGYKSRTNIAVSYFIKEVVSLSNDVATINFDKILVSKGDLTSLKSFTTTFNGLQTTMNWTNNAGQGNADASDLLVVAVFCEDINEWFVFEDIAQRMEETAVFSLPGYVGTGVRYMYFFLHTANGKKASTSIRLL